MGRIDGEQLIRYRQRRAAVPPVGDAAGARALVQRHGFIYAFTAAGQPPETGAAGLPMAGDLPDLFSALDTEAIAQKWEWAWGWRDRWQADRSLLAGRLVRGKPVLADPAWVPAFYGMAGHTADPAEDLRNAAEAGTVDATARRIHTYLSGEGPASTRTLLRALGDGSREFRRAVEWSLQQLEGQLLIAALGAEGKHSYARVWDLFPRVWPDAATAGAAIPTREAARQVVGRYLQLAGAVRLEELHRVFPWCTAAARRGLEALLAAGAAREATLAGRPAVAVPELVAG